MTRFAKVAATILALVLIGAWVWFSNEGAEVALEDLYRRAGENAEYPARGTFAFCQKCVTQLGGVFLYLCGFGAVPLIIALSALFYGCSIRSLIARSAIILMLLLLPLTVSAGYYMLSQ